MSLGISKYENMSFLNFTVVCLIIFVDVEQKTTFLCHGSALAFMTWNDTLNQYVIRLLIKNHISLGLV